MTAAVSRRRRAPVVSRTERMAKLLARTGFDKPLITRVVPDEEPLYRAIDPETLSVSAHFVDGKLVGLSETFKMRRRAFAAKAWLARRLARLAIHEGFATMWRGAAREAIINFRRYHRAYLIARAEGR